MQYLHITLTATDTICTCKATKQTSHILVFWDRKQEISVHIYIGHKKECHSFVSHISLVVTHCTHLHVQKYKKLFCTVFKYRQISKQNWHWNPAHVLSSFYINVSRFTKHELKILCNTHLQWLWWHLCGIIHTIYTLSNSVS